MKCTYPLPPPSTFLSSCRGQGDGTVPLLMDGEVESKIMCPQVVISPILNEVPDTGTVSLTPEVPISVYHAAKVQHLT